MNSQNIMQPSMDQYTMGTDLTKLTNSPNIMNRNVNYNDNYSDNNKYPYDGTNLNITSRTQNNKMSHGLISGMGGSYQDSQSLTALNRQDNRQIFDDASSTYSSISDKNSSQKSRVPNINPNITKLISDINKSLDDYAPTNSKTIDDTEEDDEINENSSEGWLTKIPNWIKEIFLFIVIYFIFSTGLFKKSVGTYIKYINPDDEGNVSFLGIIIYGLLLIITFMIARYFLIKY